MQVGVLPWTNENSLTPYPLTRSFGYDTLLVDANFIQFDGFVPILKSISRDDDSLVFTIQFDLEQVDLTVDIPEMLPGVTVPISSSGRFLGSLTVGTGTSRFVDNALGTQSVIELNIPFISSLVKSIPSTAGVYSIESKYGDLTFEHDSKIWYDVDGQDVTFNAVSGLDYDGELYLKTLNSVSPIDHGVRMEDNQVIKIRSTAPSVIEISLVGTELSTATKPDAIIVTNG